MKNIGIVLALLFCLQTIAQRKPKIKGNKSVVDVVETLPGFNAIELNDDLEITLKKANEESYQLTIDDNLIDVLKFKVVDGTLVISSFYKITAKKKLDITVNYFELKNITMRDGRIRMDDVIETDMLTIETYGAAKLQLNANTSLTNLTMEGNSSGDLNLESDSLNLKLKDRIDVGLFVNSQQVNLKMDSSAGATLEGSTYALQAKLNDKANLKARKLEATGVELMAEGSPSARVYASEILELSSKGSSKTYISGDAEIDILEFLDTSELHKEK